MEKLTPHQIIERLGAAAIAERVCVSADAVYQRKAKGVLPAAWYPALCDMAGETLPLSAFSFKGLD